MNALILAAGFGSRLADAAPSPKPLVEVAGRSLLEWSVRQAALAGVRRAVVVTGHRAAEIEASLPGIAARTGVTLEPCRTRDWSLPNGFSVLAGARRIRGNYLLMMADHLFCAELLARLTAHMNHRAGAMLAIDRDCTGPAIDPADATWVSTREDGSIAAIGKHLAKRDAVDCGAFIATPDLAHAIRAAIAGGAAGSLSDGMQHLAAQRAAVTLDVSGHSWIDVDDPAMLALARQMAPAFLDAPAPVRAATSAQQRRAAA
jgi:choline kinase